MSFIKRIFGKKVNDDLEEILIAADIAPDAAKELAKSADEKDLREKLLKYARRLEPDTNSLIPDTLLIVGANGAGKTTTIGKLAARWAGENRRVVIGSGDTFRAAATEQLDIWAERAGAEVIHGTEPAAVAYKTLETDADVKIIDTAGRLHNRQDLMDELAKIVRVMKKLDPSAPSDTWLVLDGSHGQNALAQIEFFNRAAPLTGLIATKMDGTGRQGFLITYAAREAHPLPVIFTGWGERAEDLRPFSAEDFVNRILD
ncbi:MAG: signal recognition particle-docking protein FtsY [Rickettsiales bacterium]|jgi:fused signal recognition particle receptor|nr:signal recognition particle-docking protein FtsY [Rickettsiales bacterium]